MASNQWHCGGDSCSETAQKESLNLSYLHISLLFSSQRFYWLGDVEPRYASCQCRILGQLRLGLGCQIRSHGLSTLTQGYHVHSKRPL